MWPMSDYRLFIHITFLSFQPVVTLTRQYEIDGYVIVEK